MNIAMNSASWNLNFVGAINSVGMYSKEVDTLRDLNQECSPRILQTINYSYEATLSSGVR